MERLIKSKARVCLGVLSKNAVISPPMAMFLSTQNYYFDDILIKTFCDIDGVDVFNVLFWQGCQDSDYYFFINGDLCPQADLLYRLVHRKSDIVVPPVINRYGMTNIYNNGKYEEKIKLCGFEECDHAQVYCMCLSKRALSSILMAMININESTTLSPVKDLGIKVYVDWTIEPILRWEDEHRERKSAILDVYGVWYTRVKGGLPIRTSDA